MASVNDVFRLFVRHGLAGGVHFGKVLPQFVGDLQLPRMRDHSGLESTDTDRFAVLNAASQKRFESGLLVGREFVGIANHIEILFTVLRTHHTASTHFVTEIHPAKRHSVWPS